MKIQRWMSLAVVVVALGGCGGQGGESSSSSNAIAKSDWPEKLRPLEITIDGYPDPNYAGFYLAEERGYFEDAGLELSIHTPILPSKAVPYVNEGAVDLAVSHEPEVVLARERGVPVVAVGALIRAPTTSLIWLRRTPIRTIADLKGKTIATEGLPYQKRFLAVILAREGLALGDVKLRKVGYKLTAMLEEGRVDAIIGGSWNVEGPQLRAKGLDPIVVPVSDWGMGGFDELVVIARQDQLKRIGDEVRDFLAALARGVGAAEADPDAATQAVLDESPEASPRATAKSVELTLPLLSRSGHLDPAQWRRFVRRMQRSGVVKSPP